MRRGAPWRLAFYWPTIRQPCGTRFDNFWRTEIELVGEAADFSQVMQMSKNLKPEVILIDLRLVEKTPQQRPDADGPRLLPMSIERDEEARSLAERLGTDLLVDKFNLYDELIPAIIKLASKAKHNVAR